MTRVVSPKAGKIRGWHFTEWGKEVAVDVPLDQAMPHSFDALLLPGGVMNPDKLRMEPKAVAFVRTFFTDNKPVAAICHGPWMIIEAGAAGGRKNRVVAFDQDGPAQRPRGVVRPGSGSRPQSGLQPQAG